MGPLLISHAPKALVLGMVCFVPRTHIHLGSTTPCSFAQGFLSSPHFLLLFPLFQLLFLLLLLVSQASFPLHLWEPISPAPSDGTAHIIRWTAFAPGDDQPMGVCGSHAPLCSIDLFASSFPDASSLGYCSFRVNLNATECHSFGCFFSRIALALAAFCLSINFRISLSIAAQQLAEILFAVVLNLWANWKEYWDSVSTEETSIYLDIL